MVHILPLFPNLQVPIAKLGALFSPEQVYRRIANNQNNTTVNFQKYKNTVMQYFKVEIHNLSTTDILDEILLSVLGNNPVKHRMFTSIPGLYSLDVNSTSPIHQSWSSKISSDIIKCPQGSKIIPSQEPLLQRTVKRLYHQRKIK